MNTTKRVAVLVATCRPKFATGKHPNRQLGKKIIKFNVPDTVQVRELSLWEMATWQIPRIYKTCLRENRQRVESIFGQLYGTPFKIADNQVGTLLVKIKDLEAETGTNVNGIINKVRSVKGPNFVFLRNDGKIMNSQEILALYNSL